MSGRGAYRQIEFDNVGPIVAAAVLAVGLLDSKSLVEVISERVALLPLNLVPAMVCAEPAVDRPEHRPGQADVPPWR